MKVLHVIGGDLSGGAARGAYWLHQGLMNIGVDSKIITNSKIELFDTSVKSTNITKKQQLKNVLLSQLDQLPSLIYKNKDKRIFSTGFFGANITNDPIFQWADIINLHWINGGLFRFNNIGKIIKPVVWTMRDMWPMTGGCHYAMACENYKIGCGNCVQLNSKSEWDLSKLVLSKKKRSLPDDTVLVGISKWLTECAIQSDIFKNHRVETIANCLSVEDFYPIEKSTARKILNLPSNKKVVLIGATGVKDFYKGFDVFLKASNLIKNKDDCFFLFFGNLDPGVLQENNLHGKSLGFLHDLISMRVAYSAADVFVAPSVMEAFGKTLIESMACGTPVVCFDATGPKDIVTHESDGYKATPFDPASLANGIDWVLNHPEPAFLIKNARKKILECFELTSIAKQYKALYEDILAMRVQKESRKMG